MGEDDFPALIAYRIVYADAARELERLWLVLPGMRDDRPYDALKARLLAEGPAREGVEDAVAKRRPRW
jgi:hypothetical protein